MQSLTRRQAMIASAAAIAATATGPSGFTTKTASAAAPLSPNQAPGFYRRNIGSAQVTALLDGYLDISHSLWTGIDEDRIRDAVSRHFLPQNGTIRIGITSYLVNTGEKLILVDSGSTDLFGPTAGKFATALAAAGQTPDQVDDILITHMHPDHITALTNGTAPAFGNANIHVNATELDFWASEANMAAAPDGTKSWYQAALNVRAAYDGRINTFVGEPELMTGVSALALPGHTPGQTGYRFDFGGEELLIWGDACGVAPVQFQHPEAGLVFDVDGETGKATRAKLLDMAAHDKVLVASAHCPFPSFGHVARSGSAYAWVPDAYRYEA